jgi:hypothetical protein
LWLQKVLKAPSASPAVTCVLTALQTKLQEGGSGPANTTTNTTINTTINTVGDAPNTTSGGGSTSIGGPRVGVGGTKRKYPDELPSFFGSVTAASRKKKMRASANFTATSASSASGIGAGVGGGSSGVDVGSSSLTYGKCLLRLDLDALVASTSSDDVCKLTSDKASSLKNALRSRSAYEAAFKEKERLVGMEAWRKRTKTSSRHVSGKII